MIARAPRLALVLTAVLLGGAAPPQEAEVTLVGPFAVTAAPSSPGNLMRFKVEGLGRVDPAAIEADEDGQALSLFGREGLAGESGEYRATACAPLANGAGDAIGEIARRARATRVVIVNESHMRSEHRGFIAQVAERLRPLGYGTLAMETLSHGEPDLPERFRPAFVTRPDQPYLEDGDGYYLSEAGFGRLGRRAKAFGYRLLPYEQVHDAKVGPLSREESIARREEAQASTLAAYLTANPDARVLVHVGYSHAGEVPHADGARWMANRLKTKTGIDPLTVSQTTCRGGAATTRLAALPADEPAGMFDLVVDHPTAAFVRGRPAWRIAAGDRAVDIPATLRPAAGWRVIEARPEGEPAAAVPMDRVAIRPGDTDVALLLPPGRYTLTAYDVAPAPPRPAR